MKVPIQAARALVDVFQSALDVILYMYNDYAAGQAEQSERFDRAAQYRDLMRGNAFDAMTDWLQGAVNGLLMIPYASTVRTVGIVAINLATSGPSMDLTTWKGPTIDGTMGTLENLADAVSDTTVANDLLSEMGAATPGISPVNIGDLADPMRVDPEGMGRHYVERRPLAGAGALSDARSRTVDWLTQSYNNLRGDDPSWYQALVNDIANPANGPAYKEATSPSYWLGELLRNMPALGEFLADHSLEGIATGCEAAASVLPAAQPVFDSIALMVLEMKPQLQEVLGEVNAYVQQHAVDLSALEDFANEVEQGLEGLRSMLDPADALDSVADSIVGTLEGLRVDPARFGLPSWLPVDIESVVAPVNDAVDGAIAQVRAMQEELVEAWRERVESILLAVEAQVAAFRAQVSEGGAFHNSLVREVEEFKGLLAQAEEAFAEWDGVVELDARAGADWLRAVAAAARTAADEEQFLQEEGADPWPAILRDTAQPAIDAWRGRHQADVESQYSPPVPQWEVDACVQLAGEVLDDP
ncbi:MAG TPA: hypothetical protein PKW90_17075, partial [Myxococcota bacterium]|nr:hypothetical protein [Myxococcota bacterium]